jgi:hypothetical protein
MEYDNKAMKALAKFMLIFNKQSCRDAEKVGVRSTVLTVRKASPVSASGIVTVECSKTRKGISNGYVEKDLKHVFYYLH